MTYTTNVDILNNFFGLKLKGWYRGHYCSKTNPNRTVWFPKLDYCRNGNNVSGDPNWSNKFVDNSREILLTRPVHPESQCALAMLENIYWDPNIEWALFARTRNSDGSLEAKYYGIYCFDGGDQKTGERRYKRIKKEINKNTAADWLH